MATEGQPGCDQQAVTALREDLTKQRERIDDLERELKPWRTIRGFLGVVVGLAIMGALFLAAAWLWMVIGYYVIVALLVIGGLIFLGLLIWGAPDIARGIAGDTVRAVKNWRRRPGELVGGILLPLAFWTAFVVFAFNACFGESSN